MSCRGISVLRSGDVASESLTLAKLYLVFANAYRRAFLLKA